MVNLGTTDSCCEVARFLWSNSFGIMGEIGFALILLFPFYKWNLWGLGIIRRRFFGTILFGYFLGVMTREKLAYFRNWATNWNILWDWMVCFLLLSGHSQSAGAFNAYSLSDIQCDNWEAILYSWLLFIIFLVDFSLSDCTRVLFAH